MYLHVEASRSGARAQLVGEWSLPDGHGGPEAAWYAEAAAIEREAAARSREIAALLEERGELTAAALFRKLARYEQHQANEIERCTAAWARSPGGQSAPLARTAPDGGLEGIVFPQTKLFDAIRIALGAPQRAKPLFERLARTARDAQLRALARQLAAQEGKQALRLRESLGQTQPAAS
ncbi:MAG: hypothetical protein HYZ19_01715 [Rhodocyclales bacterium]|nr:hypothetical protein [Rhodocyclales bacterium]